MQQVKVKAASRAELMAVQKPKQSKGERRRAEILGIARTLLIEQGYDEFVLRAVATKAEMKLGNLQYYFPTREDLLETLGDQEFLRGLEIVRTAQEEAESPKERLALMANRLLNDWQQTGGRVYAVIAMLALHQERFRKLHATHYRLFYRTVAEFVSAINPDASQDACLRAARLITTLMDGALFQVPQKGRGSKRAHAAFNDEIVALIVMTATRPA